MAFVHYSGGVELNGVLRAQVTIPTIKPYWQVNLKGMSRPVLGSIIVSDIINQEGFGISSTNPADIGQTIYFDLVEVEGAREKWETQRPMAFQTISTPQ